MGVSRDEFLTRADELNLILRECRRQAGFLSWDERARLARERAGSLGASDSSDTDNVRTAGFAIRAMVGGWASLPDWATEDLRRAVSEARAFWKALEVGRKMGEA